MGNITKKGLKNYYLGVCVKCLLLAQWHMIPCLSHYNLLKLSQSELPFINTWELCPTVTSMYNKCKDSSTTSSMFLVNTTHCMFWPYLVTFRQVQVSKLKSTQACSTTLPLDPWFLSCVQIMQSWKHSKLFKSQNASMCLDVLLVKFCCDPKWSISFTLDRYWTTSFVIFNCSFCM
jgi:hypothetical protein